MKSNTLQSQRGLTLVELLVSMAIGLVVTLAVTSIVIVGESNKRTTASINDANQGGAYGAYVLDRVLRSAGSGFAQAWDQAGIFGCRLSAARPVNGTPATIMPRAAPYPAPFSGVPLDLRVAPVLIANGGAGNSDVIVVMGGNAAAGDVTRPIRLRTPTTGASELELDNTIGFFNLDLGLVSQRGSPDCLFEQVNVVGEAAPPVQPPYTPSPYLNTAGNVKLPLGDKYFVATSSNGTALTTLGTEGGYFTVLGNLSAGNAQFAMIGVDANRNLVAYDLLRASTNGTDIEAVQPLVEGVWEMHAIYGMDTNKDGVVDTWVDPGAAGYDIATLMARPPLLTATAPYTMRQILAIRVALVMRSTNYEKDVVSAVRPKLFAGTPGEIAQLTLTANDQHYRYRVIDTTIPLRNMLTLPNS